MIKKILFDIRVDTETNKIGTAWRTEGYSRDSITDCLELIGLLENTKNVLKDKIRTLTERKL